MIYWEPIYFQMLWNFTLKTDMNKSLEKMAKILAAKICRRANCQFSIRHLVLTLESHLPCRRRENTEITPVHGTSWWQTLHKSCEAAFPIRPVLKKNQSASMWGVEPSERTMAQLPNSRQRGERDKRRVCARPCLPFKLNNWANYRPPLPARVDFVCSASSLWSPIPILSSLELFWGLACWITHTEQEGGVDKRVDEAKEGTGGGARLEHAPSTEVDSGLRGKLRTEESGKLIRERWWWVRDLASKCSLNSN